MLWNKVKAEAKEKRAALKAEEKRKKASKGKVSRTAKSELKGPPKKRGRPRKTPVEGGAEIEEIEEDIDLDENDDKCGKCGGKAIISATFAHSRVTVDMLWKEGSKTDPFIRRRRTHVL